MKRNPEKITKRQYEAFDKIFQVAQDLAMDLLDDADAAQRREGRKLCNRIVIARAYIESGKAR